MSHETIYRSLFIQARGALKKELMAHLRRTRGMRRSRHHTQKTSIHGQITDAVSISERPPAVEDRALPGHWEGDLLFGSKNSQIATLVERQSRYVMLAKVGGATSGLLRGKVADRYVYLLPVLTAALVIVVGCGLAARSAALGPRRAAVLLH